MPHAVRVVDRALNINSCLTLSFLMNSDRGQLGASQIEKIASVQVIRGIAATAVVCHHAFRAVTVNLPPSIPRSPPPILSNPILVELGAMGVDLFFILSGFLMLFISGPYVARRRGIGHFLLQRVIRIWPLYVVITGLALLPLAPQLLLGAIPFDFHPQRLASFLFVPSFNEKGGLQPILGVGWTLNYEVFFYVCFALCLIAAKNRILLALSSLLLGCYALGLTLPPSTVAGAFLSNAVIFEFLIGAFIGKLYLHDALPPRPAIWLAGGVALLALLVSVPADSGLRLFSRGVPAAALFIGLLLLDKHVRWPQLLCLLGNASYSIYLVHTLVLYRIYTPFFRAMPQAWAAELSSVFLVLASLFAGWLCYLWLELPMLNWLRGRGKQASTPVAQQA